MYPQAERHYITNWDAKLVN